LTARANRYKKKMVMSQNDTDQIAQEFLRRMGGGAEPAEIAKLFSENMEWEIAGDTGVLSWIGKKSGRAAVTDFVRDSRALIDRISFEVHDILAGDDRTVILGSLASKLKRAGKVIKTDFAIVLTVANGEIVRFQMLEQLR
jgi:ketosteroid isomerase-like protein